MTDLEKTVKRVCSGLFMEKAIESPGVLAQEPEKFSQELRNCVDNVSSISGAEGSKMSPVVHIPPPK